VQPVAEQFDRGVDLVEIDLGERVVYDLDVVPVAVPALDLAP
jgi:hypothetical protein